MYKYEVIYHQDFNGKTLKDSYMRTVKEKSEIATVVRNLHEDPCVFMVEVRLVE